MKKKERKLYILTIICTLIALLVMVVYNSGSFYKNAATDMDTIGESALAQGKEQLESYLTKGMDVLQVTAITAEYMLEKEYSSEEIKSFLVRESEQYKKEIDENFTGIYGLFRGEYIDGSGWLPDKDYEPTTREWYIAAKKTPGKPVLVSPYIDAQTNTIMISISQTLNDGESVISFDIALNRIQEITENISLNDMGFGFVVDKAGLVVAHSDRAEKGKNYLAENADKKRVFEKAYEGKSKSFLTELSGNKYTVFSDSVMDDWRVVMLVSNAVLFSEVKIIMLNNIIVCGLMSIVIIAFYTFTFRKMRKSVERERESNQKVEQMNEKIVRALARTIDAKDRYTNGHSQRVAEYSLEIARRMNKPIDELREVYYAGLLHDVGKIRVSEDVINKTGKLTDEEFEQIKIHPVTGFHILKEIYEDQMITAGAKYHHERYDGKGYPNGLLGANIPEVARIIGVADAYDAMASNRSYRKALPQEVIRNEIEKGKGTQFDPVVADIMLQMIDEDTEYNMKETDSLEKTILVVDDELMNIKMTEYIMKDEPMCKLISATSGAQALKMLDEISVDLILLDVLMPDMDGFETLELIREKYEIPVVFMTGDKNFETIQKANNSGVDDYVTKPFLPQALKEVIHSMLFS